MTVLFLTFQVGAQRLALDVRRVREVVPRVPLERSPLSPDWFAGIFVFRGAVVPVVDLHRAMKVGNCPDHLSSRIILVSRAADSTGALTGLLAAQVVDVREFDAPKGAVLADGAGVLHIVELEKLLPPDSQIAGQTFLGAPA